MPEKISITEKIEAVLDEKTGRFVIRFKKAFENATEVESKFVCTDCSNKVMTKGETCGWCQDAIEVGIGVIKLDDDE